jgi:hypothetical protein
MGRHNSGFDQTFADCKTNEFGAGGKPEFSHEVAFVGVDGFHAEVELSSDFLKRKPFGKQEQDLALAGAEFMKIWRGRPGAVVPHDAR